MAKEHFERHKQPWNGEEAGQIRMLAGKGKGLREIAKALNRSEESTKPRRTRSRFRRSGRVALFKFAYAGR